MRALGTLALLALLSACASHTAPHAASPTASDADAEAGASSSQAHRHHATRRAAPAEEAEGDGLEAPPLPHRCGRNSEECLPPVQWVSKLCSGIHPELALHMFRGGSPWKRLYSRAIAPAFNGAGGPSISDERVKM